MNTTIEVRCIACGSRRIAHEQGYLVRSMVSQWGRNEHGELVAEGFAGIPDVRWDSDIGDGGYVCMDCNAEMIDLDAETEVTSDRPVRAFSGGDGQTIRDAARDVLQAWRKRSFRIHELMDKLQQVIGYDGAEGIVGSEASDAWLQPFDVTYRLDGEDGAFCCQAEDAEHATEQAANAYPGCTVIEAKPVREACVDLKFDG